MKKTLPLCFLASLGLSAFAQNKPAALDPSPEYQEAKPVLLSVPAQTESASQSLIWSEDFANGIPAGWSQNGSPSLAIWEYRGVNNVPNVTVGSRGCWAGPLQSGNLGDPILSPTAFNGFMIFDSDFLHSNGDRATNGQGAVPAPHVGRLRTDTIDLSGESGAELTFHTYARRFQSAWYVAISTDGGITFPDTVEVFPVSEVAVNASTAQNAVYKTNISQIVANKAYVVLEFIFDGNLSNSNGSGRYFWMIDDIELNRPPANQLVFTRATVPGTSSEAPAHDIIYNGGANGYPKYLNLALKQAVPIEFDSNIFNYGSQSQTNVRLEVEVWDVNNNLVSTLVSPAVSSLNSLDTAYYTTLTTNSWTPTVAGDYRAVYKATSDSISSATTTAADTFNVLVGDSYSLDDGVITNYFGSNTGTNGIIAFGVLYALEQEDTAGDPGFVYLQGVDILLSCLTDSTADIEIAIWDTLGFEFNRGYPPGSSAIYRKAFTLDGSAPCNLTNFSLENAQGEPLKIPTGTYHVVANFFPNAPAGVIRVANSATWNQPSLASVFQNQNGDWFSQFTNSTTFVSPLIRLVTSDPANISIVEESLADFSVYPNPSTGYGFVEFTEAGSYELSVYTMLGQEVHKRSLNLNANEKYELNLGHLSNGVYLLNISTNNGESKTVQLTIQN
tara:strand:- start:1904 stop:3919 length:2016 start_codon:yes stop_codon:yes gene_type:complete